ncbi:MAG: CoA-binding protein [Candidatus Micrarchaeia archaeon]|jgi:acetyltransferase
MIENISTIDTLMNPQSVAVIGASQNPASVGQGVLKSLLYGSVFEVGGARPFPGKVYPVNPKHNDVLGKKCYASVHDIPGTIDVAVICVPASVVLQVVRECGQKKVKALIITSAGFAEIGKQGKMLQEQVSEEARKHNMIVVGPNCLGLIRPPASLNASFALAAPKDGEVAFISQSGALSDSVIDWAIENKFKFSLLASVGNSASLDTTDFIEWCETDPHTKAIAVYLEGIKDGRRFMQVCSRVSKTKPIVLLKAGRSAAGSKSAGAHTGSLVGSYRVWKAACRQSGVVLANDFEELFEFSGALASQKRSSLNSVAIITNGGGAGVLCADYCEENGIKLAELSEDTLLTLDSLGMHPAYSRRNPLDLVGDALPQRYKAAIDTLISNEKIGGIIVMQTLQTMTDTVEDAKLVIEAKKKFPGKPITCVFMGGRFTRPGSKLLVEHGIAEFNDPRRAARTMAALLGLL